MEKARRISSEGAKRIREKLNDPEYVKSEREKRKKIMEETNLDNQLGFFIGEYIYFTTLPTLSSDFGTTRNCIKVTEEEEVKERDLSSVWHDLYSSTKGSDEDKKETSKKAWDDYQEFRNLLKDKYLPSEIRTLVPCLRIENMEEFKQGLIDSLWNSDVCQYSLNKNDIKVETDQNYYHTIITLKR